MPDVLPSSLPRITRNAKRGDFGWTWIPIFCASCSTPGGRIPEHAATFAFYLCDDCYAKHGHLTSTYVEPDLVFWQRVQAEWQEQFGDTIPTQDVLLEIRDAGLSPLASLLREGPTKGSL